MYQYSKNDIKEAVKAAMKKEFLEGMQSSVKVKDRLSVSGMSSPSRNLVSIGPDNLNVTLPDPFLN